MKSPKVIENEIINYSLGELTFIVAENETSEHQIEKTFSSSGGMFTVSLSKESLATLSVGVYLYKIIITDIFGNTVTQKSGNFYVNWGA